MAPKTMTDAMQALTRVLVTGGVGRASGPAAVLKMRDDVRTELLTADEDLTMQEANEATAFALAVGDLVASYVKAIIG
jgi:hypothetical protein